MNEAEVLSTVDDINLLAFNKNNIYKVPLSVDTQKLLNNNKILVGQSADGIDAEIFNDYNNNTANGECGHAEGKYTHADYSYSHVEGYANVATESFQHVQGKYNSPWQDIHYNLNSPVIHMIGNGTSENNRSNCHFVTQNGSAWYDNRVISDNYFWSRKADNKNGGYAGCVFAEDEIYVRLDEDGAYDRNYHGTDTVMKGYHKVPIVYSGTATPSATLGQVGDIYCKII